MARYLRQAWESFATHRTYPGSRFFFGARQVLVASPLRPLEHAEDSTVPAAGQAMVMLRIAYAKTAKKKPGAVVTFTWSSPATRPNLLFLGRLSNREQYNHAPFLSTDLPRTLCPVGFPPPDHRGLALRFLSLTFRSDNGCKTKVRLPSIGFLNHLWILPSMLRLHPASVACPERNEVESKGSARTGLNPLILSVAQRRRRASAQYEDTSHLGALYVCDSCLSRAREQNECHPILLFWSCPSWLRIIPSVQESGNLLPYYTSMRERGYDSALPLLGIVNLFISVPA